MNKHKIDYDKIRTHEMIYPISKKELYRVRNLLEIESFENWSDEKRQKLGIVEDSCETIFGIEFDDGAKLDYRLCCGQNNYFDEIFFQYPSGKFVDLDPTFELDDIEVDTGPDVYVVKLEIKNE